MRGFPGGPRVKNPPCNPRDSSSVTLVQEDPTRSSAAKFMCHSTVACAPEREATSIFNKSTHHNEE